MNKFIRLIAVLALATEVHAGTYWNTEIPVMSGAKNIVSEKDRERASIRVSYDIVLTDFRDPLKFYGPFLEKAGWKHHMKDVYSQFPEQFSGKLPGQDWSSYVAADKEGTYTMRYGTLWQNEADGTNATITLELSGLEGDKVVAHIGVVLAPQIDASPLLDLVQRIKDDPVATLRLARLVGGDPFDISEVNLEKIRSIDTKDELTLMYIKSVNSILTQIKNFSAAHISEE